MVRHSYASCSDFSFWSGSPHSPDSPKAAVSLMAQNGNSGVTTEAMRCSALISSVGLSSPLFVTGASPSHASWPPPRTLWRPRAATVFLRPAALPQPRPLSHSGREFRNVLPTTPEDHPPLSAPPYSSQTE